MGFSKATMSPLLTLASHAAHITGLLAPSLVRGLAQASVCMLHPLQLNHIRQRHFETPSPSHCLWYIQPLWMDAHWTGCPEQPHSQTEGELQKPGAPASHQDCKAGLQAEGSQLFLDNSTCWLSIYTTLCLKDGVVVLFNSKVAAWLVALWHSALD